VQKNGNVYVIACKNWNNTERLEKALWIFLLGNINDDKRSSYASSEDSRMSDTELLTLLPQYSTKVEQAYKTI
jgi:hypothetical protein